jgi:histidyl-tRNA synthetase
MSELIQPKVLKGFRDSLPEQEIPKKALIRKLEDAFSLFGYVPIDTPALEYTEVLLGKGGGETDKQVYRFEDNGGRDVSLRFDLTVPFARFVAANHSKLPLPFRRYHINKVWRGENTQRGRYREFYQCDFDIVGTRSVLADLDTLLLMAQAMETLGVAQYTIRLSHRGIFNALLAKLGIQEHSVQVLRAVDKLPKIGEAKVRELLAEVAPDQAIDTILSFLEKKGSFAGTLANMEALTGGESQGSLRLKEIAQGLESLGKLEHFDLDPSITRGLDYYTGVVFETFLDELPEIGSVCSGGRYDQLAGLYTKEDLPGVGASVGLDRLLAALEQLEQISSQGQGTQALILNFDTQHYPAYLQLAMQLREAGIAAEVYPQKKKPNPQYAYAEKKGIPFVLSLNDEDVKNGRASIKDLSKGETKKSLEISQIIKTIHP